MTLPQSADAERSLLSSILIAPPSVLAMCGERGISAEHFHISAHATIYTELSAMQEARIPVDIITLSGRLRDRGLLESVGGVSYMTETFTMMPTAANAELYAEIIREKHTLREVIRACQEHARMAGEQQHEPMTVVAGLADAAARISGAQNKGTTKSLKVLLQEKIQRMEDGEPNADVIATGVTKLDRESPLRLGDMPLISGERKSGKSILALNIAANLALAGQAVLYFSLEDRTPKVIDRLFAMTSRIPILRHHAASMSHDDFHRTTSAVTKLSDKRLFIRDDVFDLMPILAIARQTKAKHPDLAAIVVDYAQLVRAAVAKGANREQEVAAISRGFRLLSMELNVALLLLCQLNKDGDTRESKALEQDCTAMWKILPPDEKEPGKRTLAVPFQRNGDSGISFPITFLGQIAKIEDYAEEPKHEKRKWND